MEAILFDLDGTLLDTLDLIVACWQYATEQHCETAIPREAVLPTIGLPLRAAMEEYAPGKGEVLFTAYQDYNQQWHDRMTRLVPGTVEMLSDLRARGIKTGMVTAKRRAAWEMGTRLFGLDAYLDVLIGLDDVPRPKPAPDPVWTALAALGLDPDPQRVAYVGDAVSDMACAQAAGVRAVGVAWGAAPPDLLHAAGANPVLSTWEDLGALLG